MLSASSVPVRLYKQISKGCYNIHVLREPDPQKALQHLEDFVGIAGAGSIRAIVVDIDKGTLLLHDNGRVVTGIHYPVLTCGVPGLARYVKRVFDVLLWGGYFDYIDIAGAYRLYIEAFMKDDSLQ